LTAFERVGGQGTDLDGVLHQIVQHGPLAVGGVGGRGGPVLLAADPAEQRTAAGSAESWAAEFGYRDRGGLQPAHDSG
jgi:hypothetical protein